MRRIFAAAFGMMLLSSASFGAERVTVVDGDTVRWNGELVRVVGIDTPELRGACVAERQLAVQAQERLRTLSASGVIIELQTRRDRYGRLLGVLRDPVTNVDLGSILVQEGLARPYNGRTRRQPWCVQSAP